MFSGSVAVMISHYKAVGCAVMTSHPRLQADSRRRLDSTRVPVSRVLVISPSPYKLYCPSYMRFELQPDAGAHTEADLGCRTRGAVNRSGGYLEIEDNVFGTLHFLIAPDLSNKQASNHRSRFAKVSRQGDKQLGSATAKGAKEEKRERTAVKTTRQQTTSAGELRCRCSTVMMRVNL